MTLLLEDTSNRPSHTDAKAYVADLLGRYGDLNGMRYMRCEDGTPSWGGVVLVHIVYSDGSVIQCDVWNERREDGSTYIYGEY